MKIKSNLGIYTKWMYQCEGKRKMKKKKKEERKNELKKKKIGIYIIRIRFLYECYGKTAKKWLISATFLLT